ncbi:hypothetical protein JL720_5963 [Aureococcus anophagefferens]|nr:hypothetical protein JL720_5963 [Aureococcus anophagefferens]
MPSKKEVKKAPPKKEAAKPDPLFQATPRNFRVGGDIQPARPEPFATTLDKNQAAELFKLLMKYQPEDKAAKADRVKALAEPSRGRRRARGQGADRPRRVASALCKKMDVPYCIVKNKSRLGTVVHQKTAAVCCLTTVKKEDQHSLDQLRSNFKAMYNDNVAPQRKWGGGIMGLKTQAKLAKREKALQAELAKKAQY